MPYEARNALEIPTRNFFRTMDIPWPQPDGFGSRSHHEWFTMYEGDINDENDYVINKIKEVVGDALKMDLIPLLNVHVRKRRQTFMGLEEFLLWLQRLEQHVYTIFMSHAARPSIADYRYWIRVMVHAVKVRLTMQLACVKRYHQALSSVIALPLSLEFIRAKAKRPVTRRIEWKPNCFRDETHPEWGATGHTTKLVNRIDRAYPAQWAVRWKFDQFYWELQHFMKTPALYGPNSDSGEDHILGASTRLDGLDVELRAHMRTILAEYQQLFHDLDQEGAKAYPRWYSQ